MSANPTNGRTMMVNCINVNQTFNFVTPPNMNTPVTLMMMCWNCHSLECLRPDAKSMICGICKATTQALGHDPPSALPREHSSKRAVICGISYQKSSHELKGSINDAKDMKKLLMKRFEFSESHILMLTDEEDNPFKPTKNNLLSALFWLGQGCQQDDSLVFHYSGHGLRLRNYRQREVDGYNETLCPMDFETNGMIFDDEINAVIVGHLPPLVKLHAIIDSRHTNSVLDLPHLYKKNSTGRYEWKNRSPHEFKGTSGGDAISFSGYVDVRPSANIPLLSKPTQTDSMTFHFIKAIKAGHKQTYSSILDSMQNTINKTGGQELLLSACGQFDVTKKFFAL